MSGEYLSADPLDATMVLKIGYRGAAFSGYAAQKDNVRTVAGELEKALTTFLRREVTLTCAGRTDAGVHAVAQYVSLPIYANELELHKERILRALTALTPDDISIMEVYRAAPGFSARFDAQSRSYRYRLFQGPGRAVFAYDFAWRQRHALDLSAMRSACPALIGEHDFKSFCKAASAEGKPTVRDLYELSIVEACEYGESLVCVDVRASSFLHSMVRTIVGSLVEIGQGRREPAWLGEILAAQNRAAAGPTAPAKGLTFVGVEYKDNALIAW